MRRARHCRGYSMIELLFVIGTIGFLAAVAIPRVSRGAPQADGAALGGDLRVVRTAILLYAAEHRRFPGPSAVDFAKQLTQYSNVKGETSPTRGGTFIYGPYLRTIPPCPIEPNRGSRGVLIDAINSPPLVEPDTGDGWVYNPITGEFLVNAEKLPDGVTQAVNVGGESEGAGVEAGGP